MAPLSLKVVQDEGAVTRTVKFDSGMRVDQALAIVKEKILTAHEDKDYGLFLTSADDEKTGIWLEAHQRLDYYMLRDGDQVHYLCRVRNLRVRMLDGSVKTMQVDESKTVAEMMVIICGRLGITNHDEYGLCYEGEDQEENKLAPGTGTLTLKRVTHQKERDAKLQHLSKKLKTDDHVEWLDQHKTLREMRIDPSETLLLKRRLFYTDRNVDARDPVQLNLLYVQARDAVLEGRHPVTEEKAVEFAGIQCQIHFGDFQEDKHKPGFLENLHEYLPEQYAGSRSVEKKILKEYSKHQGLSQIDAKHLYTRTVRDLPTYGVTFFVVKEQQKGKRKLVPRLLGINAESILRLDEVTKEILQVWPLTQVKTYHAGKSETFTLNFGDYSDKEYSVKTNDAHRIRDILQGYIDIIKKRMEGKYNTDLTEYHAICEDNVQASKGNIMEHIQHNSSKVVEEMFVGPSQIITYESGKSMSTGTQIVTVQQMVVSAKGGSQQSALRGEVPMRKDMSMDFVRKLNRLNSSSVNIVTLLTEPNESNVIEARKIVETMETQMPSIIEGVQETAGKQTTEDGKKKLLDALQELRDSMKNLSLAIHANNVNPEDAKEASKRIADISTQMYFSLDPRTMKRSEFCRRSRKSFIMDDKMDATLRRASFIAAAQTVCSTVDNMKVELDQNYHGPILDAGDVEELEKAALDKMGKLNAAVALYLTAYSDPKNIDYSAAVTSMNTINELLPELAKDAKALGSVRDGKSRQELLDDIRALCDAAKKVCITNPEEHQEIQDAANDFGKISEKLIFTFNRGAKPDKRNEIIELARDVGNKTSMLLIKANTLTSETPETRAARAVDAAGARCADAARDLITCASLTAPSIHEPHCQSALTAAAEALSSSAQNLTVCWKPLVEDPSRSQIGEDLKDHTLDLAKALDRLKAAFAGLNDGSRDPSDDIAKGRKLKFITSIGAARNKLDEADNELDKQESIQPLTKESAEQLQRKLAQRIAQLNAALAALVAATSDRNNPDYATADLAISTLTELMPDIMKDGKTLSANQDEQSRASMLADLKALCDATRDICASSEDGNLEGLNSSAAKFANSSGKLVYVFNPRNNHDKEQEILDLSSSACEKASELLGSVQVLAEKSNDQDAAKLDHAGSSVADAANALLTASQLTAPCIQDPRCQATMTSSAAAVSSASQHLASVWTPAVQKDPKLEALGNKLEMQRKALERELDKLKKACSLPGGATVDGGSINDKQKLKFISSAAAANNLVQAAERELNKPVIPRKQQISTDELRGKLSQSLAQLNAAIAALVAATSDREKSDYVAADQAMDTIQHLLPLVIKDTKTLSTVEDEDTRAAMLADLKALCDATRGICDSAAQENTKNLNGSATKFADAAGKLVYVFNPRANQEVENEILNTASSACEKASGLINEVYQLAAEVDIDAAKDLETSTNKVTDAAKSLLTTAQLVAPCMDDPRCQATLLSSANNLSNANNKLASTWVPITSDPKYKAYGKELNKHRKDLELELEKLKKACQMAGVGVQDKQNSAEPMQQQRLQFISTAETAKKNLEAVQKELTKPIIAPKADQVPVNLHNKLAQNLAQLNAAIAALLAATSDRKKPDYDTAEQSVHVINQLMPQLVKDIKTLSATKDQATRNAMLDELNGLCEATHGICSSLHQGDYENLNKDAAKFANNSGKLFYVVSPKKNLTQVQQIVDLSSSACEKATQLLTGVYQLAAEVGGDEGSELDAAGSKTADAAKTLLATAQLTAPSMEDPRCQAALISSANSLYDENKKLASAWVPVTQHPKYHAIGKDLDKHRQELEKELDKLKKASQMNIGIQEKRNSAEPMQQRLQFVSAAAAAEKTLQAVQKELNKPIIPLKADQMPANLQNKLAQKLAQLNAAIAALLAATSDREKPDYDTAEKSLQLINQEMPQVVKDMKTLSVTKDPDTRNAMLDELNGLCEATHGICASIQQGEYKDLNDNTTKFAYNSGKLFYTVSPKKKETREQQIMDLSAAACQKATQLLTGVHQLAAEVGGDAGAELDVAGSRTADAANTLLASAQLTAQTIEDPTCQKTLISSANTLSNANKKLASKWIPITQNQKYSVVAKDLEKHRQDLGYELEKLVKACQMAGGQQRLQFVVVAAAVKNNLQAVQKELDKPIVPLKSDQVPSILQNKLSQSLAKLNAAIAALLAATSDRENPDYETAEQSVHVINQLLPSVVNDMKTLSATKDGETRNAMLDDLRGLCEATLGICDSLRQDGYENLNDNATKFANNSRKLFYVVSPNINQGHEHQIVDFSSLACEKATQLLTGVNQLATEVCGKARSDLDTVGSRTADAAKTLLATAQLTAPSIHEYQCQAAMLSSANNLASSARDLANIWTASPALQRPDLQQQAAKLNSRRKELEHAIEMLKAALVDHGSVKSPTRRAAPPPPKRLSSYGKTSESDAAPAFSQHQKRDFNQDFLDRMRQEENHNANLALAEAEAKKKADEEKALQEEFTKKLAVAAQNIQKAETDVEKLFSTSGEVIPALSVDQTLAVQKQMEQKLATAGASVAELIAANRSDGLDRSIASKSTATLSEVMPQMVQDAKHLRGAMNDKEREAFSTDIQSLFAATRALLQSTADGNKKLNESAVEFGNKSAKLLYVVSTDVDPSQEKEIFTRTKEIGDSTTRLAVLGAEVAGNADAAAAERLCNSGGKCATAAGTAVYTAKLVAPSIQNAECKEALVKAFNDLSSELQTYSTAWKDLESQPEHKVSIQKMKEESGRLEKLLEALKEDLRKGKLVKRRVIERVVVEDTPLRQLSCSILEDAKRRAESTNNQPEQRQKFAKYANELGQAIKQLDLTNHRCRESPHDVNKRQHLENAIQNLQVMVLQNRPSRDGKPQNNIVDLTDYVRTVAADAEKLNKECSNDQPELQTVKDHCDKISTSAGRVLNPDHYEKLGVEGASDDDIQEIGQFAQECEKRAKAINTIIYDLKDGKNKIQLQEKAARLTENANILRFATLSALSTAQSVSLDATLEDLTDLEKKIEEMLLLREASGGEQKPVPLSESSRDRVVSAATRACAGAAGDLPPAYAAYVDHVSSATDLHDDKHKEKSKEHLHKVLNLLKALTMTSSRHMATWQPRGHPETATITKQILQELDNYQAETKVPDGKTSVLKEIDINKLLVPTQTKLKLEQSQIVEKLQQTASKLSNAAGTVVLSAHKQESLARSLHAAVDSAAQLAALAAAIDTRNDVQGQKIDEATKEMSLQTYNVLKAADIVSQDPNNYATRRRLLDACRLLNDAINKLVRTSVPASKLQKDCSELTRGLQLQQSLLQASLQPSCALHYAHCVDALQNQHDVIQKINNDDPLSREEFTKTLSYVGSAVSNSTEYAAQCAYLLSIADQNKDVATVGFVDVSRVEGLSEAVEDTCHRILRLEPNMVQHEEPILSKQVQDFQQAVDEAVEKTKDSKAKEDLKASSSKLQSATKALNVAVNENTPHRAKITTSTIRVLDATKSIRYVIERVSTIPEVKQVSTEAKARSEDIVRNTRNLNNKMLSLIREVKMSDDDQDPMTWVTYNTSRKDLLEMFEALLNSVRDNGKRAGVMEPSHSDLEDELDQPRRSYVQIQLELANKWLKRPTAKVDTKATGEQAARNIIELGEKMSEDFKGTDKEEMQQLIAESKELLAQCSLKHDTQKSSQLMERLKTLRKAIERGVVNMVVEDFLEGEEPLADLDVLADVEKDETKRKFLLEKKIAELLAQLGRVTRTAKFVANAGSGGPKVSEDLLKCSEQTELLAPMLVKAAEKRVVSPDDQAAIEHYQRLLAQYAHSIANVRDLCDQAVDPMDFVQTAGETMQRIREDESHENDPRKTAYASTAITKLANRVINVSMSSTDARRDPELQKALTEVKEKLSAAVPKPNARPSRIPDWKVTTDAILRTTGEVESVLGGEIIFKKQQTSDQPIFAAALDLHTAVRGWSAKDNEIVAVAKRMAVLMAKLSDYMNTDRKRELLATSKAIVSESQEVTELALKLAHECTDIRIKTNLLQVCERIPTISGQLKMLATVKGSSLGHQGFKDDLEDMNTLVGNAQNLMSSVQEVVSAAASASVKIMSQRGGTRMKWVRKTNYY